MLQAPWGIFPCQWPKSPPAALACRKNTLPQPTQPHQLSLSGATGRASILIKLQC